MEPVSAVAIVIGLVGSLDSTLRVLHRFASQFALEGFEGSFAHLETTLRSSYRELVEVQSNLRTKWMHSQLDELLITLRCVDSRLDELRDSIQNMQKPRSKLFFRRRIRSHFRHDMKVAMSSIFIAKNLVVMINTVQGRKQGGKMLLENTRSHGQELISLNDDLTAAWQQGEYTALLSIPNTKAEQVFAWIAGPKDQDVFHEQCRAERVTGTCEWLIDTRQFQLWLQHPFETGDEGIFWCQGKPGIGKTMLASKIIDELRVTHVVAYFYMSSGRLHSASDVTTSLLRQLCLPFHLIPERLEHIYERSNGESDRQLKLDDLIEALKEASRDIHQPTMIVLDALDEVNMRDHMDFAKVISSLKGTSWKFLITSRSAQDILPKVCDGCSYLSIADENIARDIRYFVDGALKENGAVDRLLSQDPDFRSELIDTLTTRSNGMFSWAFLQTRLILDQTHLSGIRKAVQSTPSDINEIVDSALYMVGLQDIARTQLAMRTLALLTAAQASLTAEALCHAMGIALVLDLRAEPMELLEDEIPNPASVVECCMGLVTIDPVTRIVTLAHYDIGQHMRMRWNDIFTRCPADVRLAKWCMAYISLSAFSSGPCYEAKAFGRRLEQYPFLDYASRHWGQHAREILSLQKIEGDIIDDIGRLLSKEKRKNLESSLQVCEIDPEFHDAMLVKGKSVLHSGADRFQSVSSLQVATRYGLTRVVQDIIRASPELISKQDSYGTSALHEAAKAGWDDLVHILLKAGAQPRLMNDVENPPLSYAAEYGHAGITSIPHKYPAHENTSYPERVRSPVRQAAQNGHESIVSMLRTRSEPSELMEALCDAVEAGEEGVVEKLLQGASRVSPDAEKNGVPAMILAIRGGNEAILHLLLQAGGSPSCGDGSPSDCIPLHQAVRNGRANMVAKLLNHGADIEACDSLGRTVLFETLNAPDISGALLLLTNGINISTRDRMGDSVLHEAARRGAVKHASVFLNQGIGINVVNHNGSTPLHLAVQHNSYQMATLLIRRSAIIDLCDAANKTPLMYAVSAGDIKMVQLLFRSGVSVTSTEAGHKTPLMLAASAGHDEMVISLLEYGVDPNGSQTDLETPLMLAASAGHIQTIKLLLDSGADPNTAGTSSEPPLVLAASAGYLNVVKLLLERGADPNASDTDSRTSLMIASSAGHHQIVDLLLEYGANSKVLRTHGAGADVKASGPE